MFRSVRPQAARRGGGATRHAVLVGALALLGCSAGSTTNHSRFIAVHNAFQALGLGQVGHISEGSLAEGTTANFPVDLEPQCYTFVAFGGGDARDIDLFVRDANNTRVAADNSHDSQATVQFCPTARAHYTVSVRMAAGNGTYTFSSWRGSVRGIGSGGATGADGDGNGTCQTPIPIQIGQTVTGDTRHGHASQTGSCLSDGDAPELVYVLQIEHRLQVTVAAEEDYDGAMYIRTACDDASSEVPGGCNDDDGDTSHSRIVTALDPGTYYIFVDGFSDNRGAFTLTVTGADVPSPQDVCQNAAPLVPGQAVSGQTSGDPNVFAASCANHAPGPDHVYRLDVPQESRLQVFQETDYDGVLYLRRACADPQTEMACNDDAEDAQHSRFNVIVPAGTYYVFTDGFQAQAAGNFTLEADIAPVTGGSGVAGDTCQDALPLTLGSVIEGNTFQAHDDVQSPCAAAQDGYDVVYRLDVQNRSRVRLWFDSTDLGRNAVIYVTRSCAANTPNATVACRAGVIGDDSAIDTVLERGQYYVVVDSAQPRAFGRFRLQARVEDLGVIERVCRAAPLLRNRQTVNGTTQGDDRFQSSCASGSHSPENLYRLVLHRRSFVRLALTANTTGGQSYDPSLYVRAVCSDPSTERACNDDAGDVRHSLIEQNFDPGSYTVFVDGFGNHNAGSYSLETTIGPAQAQPATHPTPTPPSNGP